MKSAYPTLIPVFIVMLFFSTRLSGQVSKHDSLSRLLAVEKIDSNKVRLLWQLAAAYQSFKPDTSLQLAQRALFLAQTIKNTDGESRSLGVLATSQYLLGNYPGALNNYLLKLKIEEQRNSPRNYAGALNNIGITYILMEEYRKALDYLYRAKKIAEEAGGSIKQEIDYNIEINIGEAYYRMKIPDSAVVYFNNALTMAELSKDNGEAGAAMLGKANVLAQKGDYEIALYTYRGALSYLSGSEDADILCEVSLGMARTFENLQQLDSAAYYGNMSYKLAEKSKLLSRKHDAGFFLSEYYKKLNKYDTAFFYLQQAGQLQDSIKGEEKIKAVMALSMNEKLRQEEIAAQKLKAQQTRYQQLQWLIIAICIPALFLITLLISRIKINRRLITFMGVISLLFLFEFITLLLHPMVAEFTHHIPIFELLIFVGIAALLVPAHHRLEHILIKRLTKRNPLHGGLEINPKKIKLKK